MMDTGGSLEPHGPDTMLKWQTLSQRQWKMRTATQVCLLTLHDAIACVSLHRHTGEHPREICQKCINADIFQ